MVKTPKEGYAQGVEVYTGQEIEALPKNKNRSRVLSSERFSFKWGTTPIRPRKSVILRHAFTSNMNEFTVHASTPRIPNS